MCYFADSRLHQLPDPLEPSFPPLPPQPRLLGPSRLSSLFPRLSPRVDRTELKESVKCVDQTKQGREEGQKRGDFDFKRKRVSGRDSCKVATDLKPWRLPLHPGRQTLGIRMGKSSSRATAVSAACAVVVASSIAIYLLGRRRNQKRSDGADEPPADHDDQRGPVRRAEPLDIDERRDVGELLADAPEEAACWICYGEGTADNPLVKDCSW